MMAIFRFLWNNAALILIAAAFAWAAGTVWTRAARSIEGENEIVLRVCHWQLETGYRDAINELGKDFSDDYFKRTGKRVTIIQDAIPETVYGQFVSTNLIGGTAPDLISVGLGLSNVIWREYLNRYFVPLTSDINRPNPFNVGTKLEGVPFKQTFVDGGRSSYNEELQNYMTVPTSVHAIRLFYNVDLLEKLTGLRTPPKEWNAFLAMSEKIGSQKKADGTQYTPLASSKYHFGVWASTVADPLTWTLLKKADFNRDGYVSSEETFAAIKSGRLKFDDPAIRARYAIITQLTPSFPEGWTGKQRDEAVFLFAQQRAVFIPTGTWDARSLQQQAIDADGKQIFEVGIIDFPSPTSTDPVYGPFALGPKYDRPLPWGGFGITRTCKHPDVAFEFLQYISSLKGNEKFNEIVGWIPVVEGAAIPESLRSFKPTLRGMYGNFAPFVGGETSVRFEQLSDVFIAGRISFDEMVKQYTPAYLTMGEKDYTLAKRDWKRGSLGSEQFLVTMRESLKTVPAERQREMLWRYASLTARRQLFPTVDRAYQVKLIADSGKGSGEGSVQLPAPYELSAAARSRAKENLRKSLAFESK